MRSAHSSLVSAQPKFIAKVTSRISHAGEVSHKWNGQPSSSQASIFRSIADRPADGDIEGYAGLVIEERYQCKVNRSGLADHGIGWAALEVLEQNGPHDLHINAVLFYEEPHWGIESTC